MILEQCILWLSRSVEVIVKMTENVTEEQARWKPAPDRWSLLEVINHLYDEEKEDFRVRLGLIFQNPETPWPPIDPMNWVEARKYNERNIRKSIGDFELERKRSLEWLKGLASPEWDTEFGGPGGGPTPMRAGDLLAAWTAHDCLHTRQMTGLFYDYLSVVFDPYSTAYAGAIT